MVRPKAGFCPILAGHASWSGRQWLKEEATALILPGLSNHSGMCCGRCT